LTESETDEVHKNRDQIATHTPGFNVNDEIMDLSEERFPKSGNIVYRSPCILWSRKDKEECRLDQLQGTDSAPEDQQEKKDNEEEQTLPEIDKEPKGGTTQESEETNSSSDEEKEKPHTKLREECPPGLIQQSSILRRSSRLASRSTTKGGEIKAPGLDSKEGTERQYTEDLDQADGKQQENAGSNKPVLFSLAKRSNRSAKKRKDELTENPQTYTEAINSEYAKLWVQAMNREIQNLEDHNVYEEISLEDVPPRAEVISSRWVFVMKWRPDGSFEKAKARIVCRGFEQRVNNDETYSPTMGHTCLRLLLSLGASLKYDIESADVVGAFLCADINQARPVFVEPPTGIREIKPQTIWKLRKALYGLATAPRAWSETFSGTMKKLGYRQLVTEPTIFVHRNGLMLVGAYVDDLLLVGTTMEVAKFKNDISREFEITSHGRVTNFIGAQILRKKNGIFLIQKNTIWKLAKAHGVAKSEAPMTPLSSQKPLLIPENRVGNFKQVSKYRSLIGSLSYLANVSRPDIANSIRTLSRVLDCPTSQHWNAAIRVLRYLKGTASLGLKFSKIVKDAIQESKEMKIEHEIEAFCDASWINPQERNKGVSGYLIKFDGHLITWSSKTQTIMALSTTEAEFEALTKTSREIKWLISLTKEMRIKVKLPILIHCDNQAVISTVGHSGVNARTKHYAARMAFVREMVKLGQIAVRYVRTTMQPADIFTKALGGEAHWNCTAELLSETEGL